MPTVSTPEKIISNIDQDNAKVHETYNIEKPVKPITNLLFNKFEKRPLGNIPNLINSVPNEQIQIIVNNLKNYISSKTADVLQSQGDININVEDYAKKSKSLKSLASKRSFQVKKFRRKRLMKITEPPTIKQRQIFKPNTALIYNQLQKKAITAFNSRKIFSVYGNYKSIRKSLTRRGWVEKIPVGQMRRLQSVPDDLLLKNIRPGNEYERVLLSKLVSNFPPFFIWQPKHSADKFSLYKPFRNRIHIGHSLDFSTKQGLIGCTENAHWHTVDGYCELDYPRFYRLNAKSKCIEFLKDYRLTQCIGLVNYLGSTHQNGRYYDKINGTILRDTIDFAIEQIDTAINNGSSVILEGTSMENSQFWNIFVDKCRKIINGTAMFRLDRVECLNYLQKCRKTIERTKKVIPHLDRDGFNNVWILKPGFSSRGRGIIIMRDYDSIIDLACKRENERYIVQKYVERPLLIYRTKFDIRQFFILSINDPITIWMYKTSYLRFCSQQFSLLDFKESIHLTNYSIQKRYQNGVRDKRLPGNNMWSLEDFQKYLIENQQPNTWKNKIYPGMKRNIIGVVMSSLESAKIVPNTFEFFGCDFLLDEEYEPILLEVNATPDMTSSTRVTAKLCPRVLEDMIKVIVDNPQDSRNYSTGDFELIYTVGCPDVPKTDNDLSIIGSQIKPIKMKSTKVIRGNGDAKKHRKMKNVNTEKIDVSLKNQMIASQKQLVSSKTADSIQRKPSEPTKEPTVSQDLTTPMKKHQLISRKQHQLLKKSKINVKKPLAPTKQQKIVSQSQKQLVPSKNSTIKSKPILVQFSSNNNKINPKVIIAKNVKEQFQALYENMRKKRAAIKPPTSKLRPMKLSISTSRRRINSKASKFNSKFSNEVFYNL